MLLENIIDQLFYVYILLCENNSYYTGYTNNLKKRWESHVNGTGGCKYTRSFKPIKIAQCWQVRGSKSDAMKLESKIKRLSRQKKEALIANPTALCANQRVETVSVALGNLMAMDV